MSELRTWIGRGLVFAALAGLLIGPMGCTDTGSVTFVPEDTTEDNTGEQGQNDLRGVDLDEYLRQPVDDDASAPDSDDGGR